MTVIKRTTLATSLVAVLVLGAAGGGLAYTQHTVSEADVTAPTTLWVEPEKNPSADDPAPDRSKGRQDEDLSAELLPVPGGYGLGPDVVGFSNDAHVEGEQAEALLRQGSAGLPGDVRREHRAFVRKLDIQAIAMRSYTPRWGGQLVEITLVQMDKDAVKNLNSLQSGLADAFSVLREGPKIKGHENAKCFLTPQEDGNRAVEEMFCTAYEDDVLVSLRAVEPAPLSQDDAAAFLSNQIDRLAEGGGEYV